MQEEREREQTAKLERKIDHSLDGASFVMTLRQFEPVRIVLKVLRDATMARLLV